MPRFMDSGALHHLSLWRGAGMIDGLGLTANIAVRIDPRIRTLNPSVRIGMKDFLSQNAVQGFPS